MSALSFLNQREYNSYSRTLAHHLGSIHAAIFLSELVQRDEYHREQLAKGNGDAPLQHDGKEWWYYKHDQGIERLAMSRKEQDTAVRILEKKGLIQKVKKDLPSKRYFWVDEEAVLAVFGLSKKHSSLTETDKLVCPNGTNLNDRKGQTSHIYKEPYKEPDKDTHSVGVDSDSSSSSKFGSDGLVRMTDTQHTKLRVDIGLARLNELIEELNDYIGSTGKKYKSHYHTLKSWHKRKSTEKTTARKGSKLAFEGEKTNDGWKRKDSTLEDFR